MTIWMIYILEKNKKLYKKVLTIQFPFVIISKDKPLECDEDKEVPKVRE